MPQAWDNPDVFVGRVTTLSNYEPYPAITGSQYSSINPTTAGVIHWVQPAPIAFSNMVLLQSLNAGVAGATSQASTGSEGYSYALTAFLYSRQDYSANSSNLSFVASGSFGLSAAMGYSSTSQTYGMSWNTNTTGGTSSFSTSSNDAGWSNYASGPRIFNLPFKTTLQAGEYWAAFQHSSTSATSNSNVTLLSVSLLQQVNLIGAITCGALGASVTNASLGGPNLNVGDIAGTPTTSTTMAQSVISANFRTPVWFALSNA